MIDDRAVLGGGVVWTTANLQAVRRAFVDRPDEGEDDFLTKLKRQMGDASPDAQKLMAEMLWITLLFPSNITPRKKREIVGAIWELGGERIPQNHPLLADEVLSGIGSAGMAFNNFRWRELVFLVNFTEALKKLPPPERARIFDDYDRHLEFVTALNEPGHRQLRHMLRYFAFPDRVERMSSNRDRRTILRAFRGLSEKELREWDHRQLDDALLEIRREFEAAHPGQILDFYHPPIRDRWFSKRDDHAADPVFEPQVAEDRPDSHEETLFDFDDSLRGKIWAAFMRQYPDFADFAHPGEIFPQQETNYKRDGLRKFVAQGGRDRVRQLVESGDAGAALQLLKKTVSLNLVSYQSWRPSLGEDQPEVLKEVLRAFLDATEEAYAGAASLAGVFAVLARHELPPAWDTISVVLWALRPTDYFPIKIRHYRELAAKLGTPLNSGRPAPENYAQLMRFGHAIWEVARPKHPNDWVDVQSFLWGACRGFSASPANPSTPPLSPNIWLMAPGEKARLWDEFQREGLVAVGLDLLNDLSVYDSKKDIETALQAHDESDARRFNDALCAWEFAHVLQPGDIVVMKQGRHTIVGVGRVKSAYRYQPRREEYHHVRAVDWLRTGSWEINETIIVKTLTNMRPYPDFAREILTAAGVGELFEEVFGRKISAADSMPTATAVPATETRRPFDRSAALDQLFMSEKNFDEILRQLRRKKNLILQGPPGVGKTFVAQTLAFALMEEIDRDRLQLVQFHQSYGYEEFIQGLRPNLNGAYELRAGVFLSFCRAAAADPTRPWVFIVDEINRGNLSKIFGELMMLIEADKREIGYAMPLAYADAEHPKFFIPPNVHLIGLMNTADRSLAMVDYALRRRFAFFSLRPEIASEKFAAHLLRHGIPPPTIATLVSGLTRLNEQIRKDEADLGEGFCIGHSYFCPRTPVEDHRRWLEDVLDYEILPLLQEYWMEQQEQAGTIVAELKKQLL